MDTMFALTNLISISLVSIILALVRISILQKRIVCLVMRRSGKRPSAPAEIAGGAAGY